MATFTSDGTQSGGSNSVQSLINGAAAGDTIIIPNGTYTWSGALNVNKNIILKGASKWIGGSGTATPISGGVIIRNATSTQCITLSPTNDSHNLEVYNLAIIDGGATNPFTAHLLTQSSINLTAILLHDCYFETAGGAPVFRCIDWQSYGGVIWNCNFWSHSYDNSGIRVIGQTPWQTNPTVGLLGDPNGTINLYIEDCVFTDIYLQCLDNDQWGRVVCRHCTFNNSGCVTHGDTDQGADGSGARHTELYNCTFILTLSGPNTTGGTTGINGNGTYPLNMNYWMYSRSGSMIIHDCVIPDMVISGSTKDALALTIQKIRRPDGTWGGWVFNWPPSGNYQTALGFPHTYLPVVSGSQVFGEPSPYPAPFQPGWGSNGATLAGNCGNLTMILEPCYIWNNTGGSLSNTYQPLDYPTDDVGHGLSVFGPATPTAQNPVFLQSGREYLNNTVKPSYSPFTYPHPLRLAPISTIFPTIPATSLSSVGITIRLIPVRPILHASSSSSAIANARRIGLSPLYVQGNFTVTTTGASIVATYANSQASGNCNIVFVWTSNSRTITGVTDTAGNSYSLAFARIVNNSAAWQIGVYILNPINAAVAGNVVTASFDASTWAEIMVVEYSNVSSAKSIDVSSSANGTGIAAASTVTTTVANDTIVSFFGDIFPAGTVTTPPTYLLEKTTSPSGSSFLADLQAPSIGSYTPSWTISPSNQWTAVTLALSAASPINNALHAFSNSSGIFTVRTNAATPALIQHVASGLDTYGANVLKITLPNAVLANNCVIIGVTFNSSGSISSVTDNIGTNTWIAGPTVTSSGGIRMNTYYSVNTHAGTQTITITMAGLTGVANAWPSVVASEFNHVGTVLTGSGTSASSTTSGSFTPAAGDLIWHWGIAASTFNSTGGNFNGTAAATAGAGFTFASTDLQVGNVVQYRVAAGGAASPTFTPGSGSATWACVALSLRSANTGSIPSPGIRITRVQHTLLNSFRHQGRGNPCLIQFPASGNLFVGTFNSGGSTVPFLTSVNDSVNGAWLTPATLQQVDPNGVASAQMVYKANASGAQNLLITSVINITTTGDGMFILYDISGAAVSPLDVIIKNNGNQTSFGNLGMASPISPTTVNGLIINVGSIVFHTCNNVQAPAIFDSQVNSFDDDNPPDGGTDVSTLDMDNPYAHIYNSTTGPFTFTYSFTGPGSVNPGITTWSSISAAFKTATIVRPQPTALSASGAVAISRDIRRENETAVTVSSAASTTRRVIRALMAYQ